mmetsp:Transcript_28026/g.80429  ORF Transcript_28026/g.80429 Transcript_28026/m.80429 type:complete len:217 (-) Transcript_28026:11-661(-)
MRDAANGLRLGPRSGHLAVQARSLSHGIALFLLKLQVTSLPQLFLPLELVLLHPQLLVDLLLLLLHLALVELALELLLVLRCSPLLLALMLLCSPPLLGILLRLVLLELLALRLESLDLCLELALLGDLLGLQQLESLVGIGRRLKLLQRSHASFEGGGVETAGDVAIYIHRAVNSRAAAPCLSPAGPAHGVSPPPPAKLQRARGEAGGGAGTPPK